MAGLEKLREIGAHKIYEQTHIAKRFVEDILNENFSSMNKIQFAGFISILEREYGVDLHELIESQNTKISSEEEEPQETDVQENNSSKIGIYIAGSLVVLALLFAIYSSFSSSDDQQAVELSETDLSSLGSEFNNSMIEEAKINLNQLGDETNASDIAEEEAVEVKIEVEPIHPTKFEISPRSKLWVGIIDLETFERSQKLTSDSFELDPEKEWLLVMGHGYVNFFVGGEVQKFTDEQKVWFAYEDGALVKLSRSEFKEKNRGKAW